jgi:hypothetical protein
LNTESILSCYSFGVINFNTVPDHGGSEIKKYIEEEHDIDKPIQKSITDRHFEVGVECDLSRNQSTILDGKHDDVDVPYYAIDVVKTDHILMMFMVNFFLKNGEILEFTPTLLSFEFLVQSMISLLLFDIVLPEIFNCSLLYTLNLGTFLESLDIWYE